MIFVKCLALIQVDRMAPIKSTGIDKLYFHVVISIIIGFIQNQKSFSNSQANQKY
jgi:hypothetical protein